MGRVAENLVRPRLGRTEILDWISSHAATTPGSVAAHPDKERSISSHVCRAVWEGERSVLVSADAPSVVRISAMLDLLSWHLREASDASAERVTLILADPPTEALDAARTLRASLRSGPQVRILVAEAGERGIGVTEDTARAPDFADSPTVRRWAGLLDAWTHARPEGAALRLAQLVDHDSLRLYPMLSGCVNPARWSVRIDGLEVAQADAAGGVVDVGKVGKLGGASLARAAWLKVSPTGTVAFAANPSGNASTTDDAARQVRELIAMFSTSSSDASSLLHGQPEHALEARIVRGAWPVVLEGKPLAPAFSDPVVSRGSQFPTLWGRGGKPRYLDALLRDGDVPWAVELKVLKSGGSGQYYRHGLAQAILYRHFIRTAVPVWPWFTRAGLNATLCEGMVAFPQGPVSTATRITALRSLAHLFGVPVVEV